MKTQILPAVRPSVSKDFTKVCTCVPLQQIPGLPKRAVACCPLLQQDKEQLLAAFQNAPHFREISVKTLLHRQQEGLRVLLLGPNDYYNRQAACYLASLAKPAQEQEDHFWFDIPELDAVTEYSEKPLKNAMAVVSAAVLDPELDEDRAAASNTRAVVDKEAKALCLDGLDAPAILIVAKTGQVLSEGVLEQVERVLHRTSESVPHLFIALRPDQEALDLLEELCFIHGFFACSVGQADEEYLKQLLVQTGQELLAPISEEADLNQVLACLRRYRGDRFEESDLVQLVRLAVARGAKVPLQTEDLLVRSARSRGQALDTLQAMVGLQPVKETICRFLACTVLEERRLRSGVEVVPMCRNLAFSGPPGTGKSVTARLIARIMREEGCGTGRFVEAGREDLIAPYLGQTSPQIAALFRKAKGGVLFIDEAGALLNTNNDTYAVEAMNALVRHMELEPETMVIFATYPEEMKKLLSSNPGLSSRVAQVLNFPAYDEETLWEILSVIARQEQLMLPDGVKEICRAFFQSLRICKGENFGNGREARRLFQTAFQEMALRTACLGEVSKLNVTDFEAAAQRLLAQEFACKEKIGF